MDEAELTDYYYRTQVRIQFLKNYIDYEDIEKPVKTIIEQTKRIDIDNHKNQVIYAEL